MLTQIAAGDRHQGRRHRDLWLRRRRLRPTPLVDQAFKQGTIFTTLNTALPDSAEEVFIQGLRLRRRPELFRGLRARRGSGEARQACKAGDSVFVWGLKGQGGDRGQRTVGVIDAFTKAGVKVIYQEIDSATNADPNAGTATFVGVMGANPGIKIVVTDHGGLTSNVGVYAQGGVAEAGPGVLRRLRHVAQHGAGGQGTAIRTWSSTSSPILQGYLPILNICLTKKYGFSGLDMNTAGAFVDSSNVDAVAPLAAKEIR